jgi:molybdenum cofactor biosynthesis protein B
MVDFQSRDTRRTLGDSGDEDDDGETGDDGSTANNGSTPDEEAPTDDGSTTGDAVPDEEREGKAEATIDGKPAGGETTDDTGTAEEGPAPERDRTAGPEAGGSGNDDAVAYAVVTVDGERTLAEDAAGDAVVGGVEGAGGAVVTRELLDPSYDGVQAALDALVGRGDVDAVVTVGGTGVGPDDVTVDAASDLFGKHLPGFGEHLRALAREDGGTAAVRTRATAGMVDGVPVFCLPGTPTAVRRGIGVIGAEAGQLVAAANPDGDPPA